MRRRVKEQLERVLSAHAVSWFTRRRLHGKTLILGYHGIVPEGEPLVGEQSLFVRQRSFASQLDAIVEAADVVPLDQVDAAGSGRPRVIITFDDAYQGAVTAGVAELARRGLPATIFVAPMRLNGHAFWWDVLAHGSTELDAGVRRRALEELGGADEAIVAWAARAGLQLGDDLPSFARAASVDELRGALTHSGITLGSHTWSHANLQRVSGADLASELRRPLEWLRTHFPNRTIAWLAYPYGLETRETQEASAAAGYEGAVRIEGGWHVASAVERFARPRLNVPAGMSVNGLRARLVGAVSA